MESGTLFPFCWDVIFFQSSIMGKENRSAFFSLNYQTKTTETVSLVEFPKANTTKKKINQTEKKTRCKLETEEIQDNTMNMDQMRPLPGSFGRQEWCLWKEDGHIISIFDNYISFMASFIENQCCFFLIRRTRVLTKSNWGNKASDTPQSDYSHPWRDFSIEVVQIYRFVLFWPSRRIYQLILASVLSIDLLFVLFLAGIAALYVTMFGGSVRLFVSLLVSRSVCKEFQSKYKYSNRMMCILYKA